MTNTLPKSPARRSVLCLAMGAALAAGSAWAGDADLDPNFGVFSRDAGGLITTDLGGTGDYAAGVSVDLEDRVYTVGQMVDKTLGNWPYLVLTNTRGEPDSTYWPPGLKELTEYPIKSLQSVLVQRDGKLLLLDSDFTVSRWAPDGTLDEGFGVGGYAKASFPANSGIQSGLSSEFALQYDGSIVVAGTLSYQPNESDVGVVRYTPDGKLDLGFGQNGISIYKKTGIDTGETVAISLNSSKILVGGSRNGQPVVLWVNTGGRYVKPYSVVANPSMHVTGKVSSVAIQPTGKAVAAVVGTLNSQEGIFTMRFTGQGKQETKYLQPMTDLLLPNTRDADLLLQPDGKTIVGTTVLHALGSKQTDTDIILLRYNASGAVDSSFVATDPDPDVIIKNKGGLPIQYDFIGEDRLQRLTMQWDGKVLAAGRFSNLYGVARINGHEVDTIPSPIASKTNAGVVTSLSTFRDIVPIHNVDNGVKIPLQMVCVGYDSNGNATPSPTACQYQLNEKGDFVSTPSWVKNNDEIRLRHDLRGFDKVVSTLMVGGMLAPNNNQVTLGATISATFTSCRASSCN